MEYSGEEMAKDIAAHDALVSCYESVCREDGMSAVEMIHERRMADGSCKCGRFKPAASQD